MGASIIAVCERKNEKNEWEKMNIEIPSLRSRLSYLYLRLKAAENNEVYNEKDNPESFWGYAEWKFLGVMDWGDEWVPVAFQPKGFPLGYKHITSHELPHITLIGKTINIPPFFEDEDIREPDPSSGVNYFLIDELIDFDWNKTYTINIPDGVNTELTARQIVGDNLINMFKTLKTKGVERLVIWTEH